jgi:hypothetical protein
MAAPPVNDDGEASREAHGSDDQPERQATGIDPHTNASSSEVASAPGSLRLHRIAPPRREVIEIHEDRHAVNEDAHGSERPYPPPLEVRGQEYDQSKHASHQAD